MRFLLVGVAFFILPTAHAGKRRASNAVVAKVPSIEEVVAQEGFVPTPSQSETYRPGVVLVPNSRGGHDVVHPDCIGAEPDISIMSQSSIATSLSAGVSARLSLGRGQLSGQIEKRLTFVDPEQRTIPLSGLNPTEECAIGLQTAARFTDLSQALLVYDVLVAQIQNTVCTRADANGSLVLLGEAEAAAYSECVQESDAQVPLGFKSVPLGQVFTSSGVASSAPAAAQDGKPLNPSVSGTFDAPVDLGVDAQLAQQACRKDAEAKGASARSARMAEAVRRSRLDAAAAWRSLSAELEKCMQLPVAERGRCTTAAERWLTQARAMSVSIPAGLEPIDTACGTLQPAFEAEVRPVVVDEVSDAEKMLARLAAPGVASERAAGPRSNPSTGREGASARTGAAGWALGFAAGSSSGVRWTRPRRGRSGTVGVRAEVPFVGAGMQFFGGSTLLVVGWGGVAMEFKTRDPQSKGCGLGLAAPLLLGMDSLIVGGGLRPTLDCGLGRSATLELGASGGVGMIGSSAAGGWGGGIYGGPHLTVVWDRNRG